jgi:hypothetical protein
MLVSLTQVKEVTGPVLSDGLMFLLIDFQQFFGKQVVVESY